MRRIRVRAGEVIPLLDGHAGLHHLGAARVDPRAVRVPYFTRSTSGTGTCRCGGGSGLPVVMAVAADRIARGGGSPDAGPVGVGRAAVGDVLLLAAEVCTLGCGRRPSCVVLVEAILAGLVAGLGEGVGDVLARVAATEGGAVVLVGCCGRVVGVVGFVGVAWVVLGA